MTALRRLVPKPIRRRVAVHLARQRAAAIERELAALADGAETIVAGPWLGEVGFELLYWAPFVAWFAERYAVPPSRLLVVSRGGVRDWYRPAAGGYRDLFEVLSAEEFRQRHDERVAANGEQKQTQRLPFERDLLRRLGIGDDARVLHPSLMYELFRPFWWGHVDESWVHRYTRYRRLECVPDAGTPLPAGAQRGGHAAAKFYFSDSFPDTAANRAFVRDRLVDLAARGPVVSLTTGLNLDDHGGDLATAPGVDVLPPGIDPRHNLAVQSAVVAGAASFAGTYGGFAYLAPFYGVPATAYYDAETFSPRHLAMARSALATLGRAGALELSRVGGPANCP